MPYLVRYLKMRGVAYYDVNYLEIGDKVPPIVLPPWIYKLLDTKPNLASSYLYVLLRDNSLIGVYDIYPTRYPLGSEVYVVAEQINKRTSTLNHRYPLHPSRLMYSKLNDLVAESGLSQSQILRKLMLIGVDNSSDVVVPNDWRIYKRRDPTLTIRLSDYEHSSVEKVRLPDESNLGLATRLIYLGINTYCQNLSNNLY